MAIDDGSRNNLHRRLQAREYRMPEDSNDSAANDQRVQAILHDYLLAEKRGHSPMWGALKNVPNAWSLG
jgi:hypothetical protein